MEVYKDMYMYSNDSVCTLYMFVQTCSDYAYHACCIFAHKSTQKVVVNQCYTCTVTVKLCHLDYSELALVYIVL